MKKKPLKTPYRAKLDSSYVAETEKNDQEPCDHNPNSLQSQLRPRNLVVDRDTEFLHEDAFDKSGRAIPKGILNNHCEGGLVLAVLRQCR